MVLTRAARRFELRRKQTREDCMLTRRGFAACALCAVTGFLATGAEAENSPGGLKRTILKRIDGPMAGYETVSVRVEIDPGATIARHTHPGVESSYIISGSTDLTIEGEASKTYNAGDAFQVAAGVPHGGKNGATPTVVAATYVVEKGKPLASPA
jgi:quercetin dioxygenase-like cupin family protein